MEALDEHWDDLVDRQPLPSATLTSAWLRGLRPTGTPVLVLVRRGDSLAAGGAFRRRRVGTANVATWLGGIRLPGILSADGDAEAAAEVIRSVLAHCDALWLPATPPLGPTRPALDLVAPWRRSTATTPCGWMIELPPPRLEHARARAAYALRRAERNGAAVTTCVRREEREQAQSFDRLVRLYRERWRGRESEGNRHSDIAVEQERYHALFAALAERRKARIIEVFEDDRLVASTLGFLTGKGALFHTTATEPGGALRGPGHVAMLAWVDEAVDAGAEAMYLGRGAGEPEGPKARLGARPIELMDVLAAPSRARQRVLEATLDVLAAARGTWRAARMRDH
jgi:CelD/BcsL family acetyltransferase involved in cellulose biosynthesis